MFRDLFYVLLTSNVLRLNYVINTSIIEESDIATFTEQESDLLELVWNTYGEFSGYQLESLTHTEKPWLEQHTGLSTYEASSRVINPDTMKSYYRSLYSQDGVN